VPALESGGAARSCRIDKGRIVAISPVSRITAVQEFGSPTWYACLNRNGRRLDLGSRDLEEWLAKPRLAGSYVAFEHSLPRAGTPGPDAIVINLASRRQTGLSGEGGITGLVLSSRGDLIASTPTSVRHVRLGRSTLTLDAGDIAPGSLALSPNGRRAYWLNAGQPRSFELPR
jgi:hypothetical protein